MYGEARCVIRVKRCAPYPARRQKKMTAHGQNTAAHMWDAINMREDYG